MPAARHSTVSTISAIRQPGLLNSGLYVQYFLRYWAVRRVATSHDETRPTDEVSLPSHVLQLTLSVQNCLAPQLLSY